MGIEDFNLDMNEHPEQVLIISDSKLTSNRLSQLLAKRRYASTVVATVEEASQAAIKDLFDLIIIDLQASVESQEQVIAGVKGNTCLRRSSLLVIHSADQVERHSAHDPSSEIHFLQTPFEPSAFLVKVATQLRLRKFKTEQAGFEARIATQNAELRDLTNRFKHELREARIIQQSILPKRLPTAPKTIFAACFEPLEAVGGDLFDLWKMGDSAFGLFVADVSGHGLAAAFIGAMTKMALSYAVKDGPAEMLGQMNDGLGKHMPEGRFATAIAAFYDVDTGRLRVARAGHPPGIIWRAGTGQTEQVAPRGLPLGVMSGCEYEPYETTINPGDKLLLVTDGLTETIDMNGKVLGTDGVASAFADAAGKRIDEGLRDVLEEQKKFSGGRILKDDVTLVAFERLP